MNMKEQNQLHIMKTLHKSLEREIHNFEHGKHGLNISAVRKLAIASVALIGDTLTVLNKVSGKQTAEKNSESDRV